MIKNMRHFGIVVDDLEASLGFYRDVLGFKIFKQADESGPFISGVLALEDVKVTTVKMTMPNGSMVELLKFHSHPGALNDKRIFDVGPTHFAITVDNVQEEYKRLRQHGIVFNSAPKISPDGFAEVAFCRAPEGTFIEIVEEKK